MKVLFVTTEVASIKKFGGLGDYSASLPKALNKLGIEVDIIMPFYDDVNKQPLKIFKLLTLEIAFGGRTHHVDYFKTKLPGSEVSVILVRNDQRFSGDFINDIEYFAFFDKCVADFVQAEFNIYNLLHCNDWHTGFLPHLLEEEIGNEKPPCLITIHNLGYKGVSDDKIIKALGLVPANHPLIEYDMQDGSISMLYQGITSCDFINTVSKSYREELISGEEDADFVEALNQRHDRFTGILNGIDYDILPRDFDIKTWNQKKPNHKKLLQQQLKIDLLDNAPLFGFVSRLDPDQKGLDILYDNIPQIVNNGGQVVILGTGDPGWETKFKDLKSKYSNSVSVNIVFDESLALKIFAGADFFLLPSRYEPCGLTQMMSMYYGTIPIAHNVGGLKDTIADGDNGFVFNEYNSASFAQAINRGFDAYVNKTVYASLLENSLLKDFSWDKSAKEYEKLYKKIYATKKSA